MNDDLEASNNWPITYPDFSAIGMNTSQIIDVRVPGSYSFDLQLLFVPYHNPSGGADYMFDVSARAYLASGQISDISSIEVWVSFDLPAAFPTKHN